MSASAPTRIQGPRIAGYAAIFHKRDLGGDVIRPGAFAATLADWKQRAAPIPLLLQHNEARQIGVVEQAHEDERGLRIIARLDADQAHLAQLRGLSFGYAARHARPEALADGRAGRQLLRLDLSEISLVTHPMQRWAAVHLVV